MSCQGPRLFSSGGVKVIFQFSDHGVSFLFHLAQPEMDFQAV